MPLVAFDSLPDASRVWVFGSDRTLSEEVERELLVRVDEYLEQWKAHGDPLTVGRQWRDGRFLVIGVDQSTAGASGCSIDGLFRVLQQVQRDVDANLVGGGKVFYRDNTGTVQSVDRSEVENLAATGAITKDTVVFDTTLTDLGTWRGCFERPAKDCWVGDLLTGQP
jgi:hypothetical protein